MERRYKAMLSSCVSRLRVAVEKDAKDRSRGMAKQRKRLSELRYFGLRGSLLRPFEAFSAQYTDYYDAREKFARQAIILVSRKIEESRTKKVVPGLLVAEDACLSEAKKSLLELRENLQCSREVCEEKWHRARRRLSHSARASYLRSLQKKETVELEEFERLVCDQRLREGKLLEAFRVKTYSTTEKLPPPSYITAFELYFLQILECRFPQCKGNSKLRELVSRAFYARMDPFCALYYGSGFDGGDAEERWAAAGDACSDEECAASLIFGEMIDHGNTPLQSRLLLLQGIRAIHEDAKTPINGMDDLSSQS